MDIDSFRSLIEIQGLKNRQQVHLKNIGSQELRLTRLQEEREESQAQLTPLRQELSALEQKIQDYEGRLKKREAEMTRARENLMQAKTLTEMQNLEKAIKDAEIDTNNLSDDILTFLQTFEEKNKEQERLQNFLTGLSKTIPQIEQEVQSAIMIEKKEIQNYQTRIEALFDDVPSAKEIVLNCWKKNKKAVVSVDDQDTCECGIKVGRNMASQIEKARELFTCASCGRIFIPYKATH